MAIQAHTSNLPTPKTAIRKLSGIGGIDKPWRNASMFGYSLIIIFFGLFGGWASSAPLASGVIARGSLKIEGKHKIVQHLEGGIVKEILIKEGDRVIKGQVMFRMDSIRTRAQSTINLNGYRAALAEQARLEAQLDQLETIQYGPELLAEASNPSVAKLMKSTDALYASEIQTIERKIELRRERISQSYTEIEALVARDNTILKQLVLIEEELSGVEEMYRKGLERKRRLLGLQRAQTGLMGQSEESAARIARALQRIQEQELTIVALREQVRNRAFDRLQRVNIRLDDLAERVTVVRDMMRRVDIVAPITGFVISMGVTTNGAVVGGGAQLAEIVPEEGNLLVHAKIKAKDIDSVRIGSPAKVRLSAFNPRITPAIDGTLISVSADVVEKVRGKSFYKAVIRLSEAAMDRHLKGQKVLPGMDANVIIAVGERTLMSYILTPLTASFELALREP